MCVTARINYSSTLEMKWAKSEGGVEWTQREIHQYVNVIAKPSHRAKL